MSITEKFVPHEELLELFGVERNATLMRMLDRNNISYMTNYKKRPLVLRSDIEAFNHKSVPKKMPPAGQCLSGGIDHATRPHRTHLPTGCPQASDR